MSYNLVIISGDYYRLISAMFLHIGIAHLFFNMFSLYIFGSRLEPYLKPIQYIYIYIGAGVIGSLTSIGSAYLSGIHPVSAGASGAVYGLIGSLLVVSRSVRAPIEGVTTYVLWVMFAFGIVFSIITPNIDVFAHVGGFIGGIGLTKLVLLKKQKIDSV
jgi:rhomboid protease GluP